MTLPIVIPSPPSAGASPASDDSLTLPRTPVSPTQQSVSLSLNASSNGNNNSNSNSNNTSNNNATTGAATKRKPSRRANTAERRATHNAVERQRRETLNGRFLDLAALLPNLSQIRRPSKSSIVNSSIAHIHASRRHRLLASRELRLMKLEADALRRELNEWRDRAGIPRVEEPVRGEGFGMVLAGELEVMPIVGGLAEEDEGEYGFGEDEDGYEREDVTMAAPAGPAAAPLTINTNVHPQMVRSASHGGPTPAPGPAPQMRAQTIPHPAGNVQERMDRLERLERLDRMERLPLDTRHGHERMSMDRTMIASPTSMSFDSPAVPGMYEPQIPSVASMNTMGGLGMNMMGVPNVGMGMGMGGMGYQIQMGHPQMPMGQMHGHGMIPGNAYPAGYEEKYANADQAYLASLGRRRSGSVASAGSQGSNGVAIPMTGAQGQGQGQGMGSGRVRSGSISSASSGRGSGSASPPQTGYQEGEWGYGQGMGGMNHQQQQQMMVGGMGGMGGVGSGGVAFAMMM